jgi:hypothetical protein
MARQHAGKDVQPREKIPPYELPQEDGQVDSEALEAAVSGDVPAEKPGMAGESAPGEPSRAEVFALNPELAADDGVSSSGAPTMPVGPTPGTPPSAGAPLQGRTEPDHSAPPGERPADTSSPEERNQEMEPPKAPWGAPAKSPRASGRE